MRSGRQSGGCTSAAATGWAGVCPFLALLAALTLPFLLAGAQIGGEILPGVPPAGLAVLAPCLAAGIITLVEGGQPALGRMLAQAVRWPGAGLAALMLAIPLSLAALQWLVARSLGDALPAPQIAPVRLAISAALLVAAALAEEIGWAFAADRMLRHRVPLTVAVLIGAVRAVWHYPALIGLGRGAGWAAWWTLGTLATRVIMLWLYVHVSRSVMGMALYHMAANLAWQLYPVDGHHYDQRLGGLLAAALALVLAVRMPGQPPRPATLL